MQLTKIEEEDSALAIHRRSAFWGIACVRLDHLNFKDKLDDKNTQFLKGCFERVGCYYMLHPIPALINKRDFGDALQRTGLQPGELLPIHPNEYPELMLLEGYQLECLHGKDRVSAA